ncbi:MAG: Sjogren's syndrome/scleroderma autoantigen 1 family protein [Candidatus Bathyarchaeia archaeon]
MTEPVKKMADLLKSGATLLSDLCPACNSPLFDVKGKIYCVKCDKPVRIIKSAEDEERLRVGIILDDLESTIYHKMRDALQEFKAGDDYSSLSQGVSLISQYLDLLEKVKRVRRSA